jgi:hypothetical protein
VSYYTIRRFKKPRNSHYWKNRTSNKQGDDYEDKVLGVKNIRADAGKKADKALQVDDKRKKKKDGELMVDFVQQVDLDLPVFDMFVANAKTKEGNVGRDEFIVESDEELASKKKTKK